MNVVKQSAKKDFQKSDALPMDSLSYDSALFLHSRLTMCNTMINIHIDDNSH